MDEDLLFSLIVEHFNVKEQPEIAQLLEENAHLTKRSKKSLQTSLLERLTMSKLELLVSNGLIHGGVHILGQNEIQSSISSSQQSKKKKIVSSPPALKAAPSEEPIEQVESSSLPQVQIKQRIPIQKQAQLPLPLPQPQGHASPAPVTPIMPLALPTAPPPPPDPPLTPAEARSKPALALFPRIRRFAGVPELHQACSSYWAHDPRLAVEEFEDAGDIGFTRLPFDLGQGDSPLDTSFPDAMQNHMESEEAEIDHVESAAVSDRPAAAAAASAAAIISLGTSMIVHPPLSAHEDDLEDLEDDLEDLEDLDISPEEEEEEEEEEEVGELLSPAPDHHAVGRSLDGDDQGDDEGDDDLEDEDLEGSELEEPSSGGEGSSVEMDDQEDDLDLDEEEEGHTATGHVRLADIDVSAPIRTQLRGHAIPGSPAPIGLGTPMVAIGGDSMPASPAPGPGPAPADMSMSLTRSTTGRPPMAATTAHAIACGTSPPTRLDYFDLRVVFPPYRTGFEESKEFPVDPGTVIAGRYTIEEFVGSAAFSRAVQCYDFLEGRHVCVKIVNNEKDYFDQSIDEIKLLQYLNTHDPHDQYHVVRMLDFFYHREHLFIVFELLRDNLYEYSKYLRDIGQPNYFTLPRVQRVAKQVLTALDFLHRMSLIHADVKPENILIQSYSRCQVKLIDMGSSSFAFDRLHSYVQSRSYRAPEVLLGLPYSGKIDTWSLGAVLVELITGSVLFLNDTVQTLLARIMGIVGPIPRHMILGGRHSHLYFTKQLLLFERRRDDFGNEELTYVVPKRSSIRARTGVSDTLFLDFVSSLLEVDPDKRPSAAEALRHPWLATELPLESMD